MADKETNKANWTFLTNHAHVLLCIAKNRNCRLRDIADVVGITERAVHRIVSDLTEAGYVDVQRDGRCNVYETHPEKNLRLALLEAADGTIGSPFDRLVLYCYHYDPSSRRYAPVAMNIMRVGGGVTVVALGLTLGMLWARETVRRGKKEKRDANA